MHEYSQFAEYLRTDQLGRKPQPVTDGPFLKEIGEFGLISQVTTGLPSSASVLIGPGDDAACVKLSGPTLISTDVLVEGVHFRKDWSAAHQIGRKAVAENVADIEAMGGTTRALVVCLSAPGDLPVSWAQDLMAGLAAECELAGVALVGGDTTAARDITIAVTVIGDSALPPVTRSGARPGQTVAFIGRLGWAAGGLIVLSRGFGSPRALVASQQVPSPPYGQGRIAAEAGVSAMIDVSDGLLADLGHIAAASQVGIALDSAALPITSDLERLGAATGINPLQLILTGGEDHALVGTFDHDLPPGWTAIGQVSAGEGVLVDGALWEGDTGWDHFGD